jgi:hypothetical protein
MSTKSREYQALELLGPGDSEPSWTPRLGLASLLAWMAITEARAQIKNHGSVAAMARQIEQLAQAAIPPRCGIRIEVAIDASSHELHLEAMRIDKLH